MLMALSFTLICSITIPIAQYVSVPHKVGSKYLSSCRRLRVMALFSIGVFLVAISIIRIVQGIGSHAQRGHTLWASLEILLAVFVAVTPTIYALAHGRHEDSSFDRTHLSEYPQGRAFSEGTVPEHKGAANIWTEQRDHTRDRLDSASSQRALVALRHEAIGSRLV